MDQKKKKSFDKKLEVLEHRNKEEPFNISHFKEEPWQFIVELKTVKVKQKCYRGFSL